MTSEANTAMTPAQRELSRRAFFTSLGLGSLGVAAAGTLTFYYQYLSPNVLFEASPIVDEGKADNYPLDSVTLDVNAANLSGPRRRRVFFLERSLHTPGLHDGVEAGGGSDRLSMSRQPFQP